MTWQLCSYPRKWSQNIRIALWWLAAVQVINPALSLLLISYWCYKKGVYVMIDSWALLAIPLAVCMDQHTAAPTPTPNDVTSARWHHPYSGYFGLSFIQWCHWHCHILSFYLTSIYTHVFHLSFNLCSWQCLSSPRVMFPFSRSLFFLSPFPPVFCTSLSHTCSPLLIECGSFILAHFFGFTASFTFLIFISSSRQTELVERIFSIFLFIYFFLRLLEKMYLNGNFC